MKSIPAIMFIVFLFIFVDMNFPIYTASTDSIVSASMTPKNTTNGLYSAANSAADICVLSPISEMNISVNADRNGFFSSHFDSSSLLFISVISPNVMNIVPAAIFM